MDYLPFLGLKQLLSSWGSRSLDWKHRKAFLHFVESQCSKIGWQVGTWQEGKERNSSGAHIRAQDNTIWLIQSWVWAAKGHRGRREEPSCWGPPSRSKRHNQQYLQGSSEHNCQAGLYRLTDCPLLNIYNLEVLHHFVSNSPFSFLNRHPNTDYSSMIISWSPSYAFYDLLAPLPHPSFSG